MPYGTYLITKELDCYDDYVQDFQFNPNTSADGWKFAKKNKKSR